MNHKDGNPTGILHDVHLWQSQMKMLLKEEEARELAFTNKEYADFIAEYQLAQAKIDQIIADFLVTRGKDADAYIQAAVRIKKKYMCLRMLSLDPNVVRMGLAESGIPF